MGSFVSKSTIDSLPEEVLCLIFDRMDLKTVKTASLTCRKWHDIIFSSDYMKRFEFLFSFDWISDDEEDATRSQEMMESLKESMLHTQRCYTKMSLYAAHNSTPLRYIESFWMFTHQKIVDNITSLELHFTWTCTIAAMRAVANKIRLIPKLRSLRVENDHYDLSNYLYSLESNTVTHLKIIGSYLFTFYMPQLESFSGAMGALPAPNMLAKLKHVTLMDGPGESRDITIFHGLEHVETLELFFEIEDWALAAVCDTCTALKYLYVAWPVGFDVHSIALQRLSKLRNLRELVFGFNFDLPHTSLSGYDLGLSKLTQLELLNLGSSVLESLSLGRLPKSIRCLTVRITSGDEARFIETITSSLPQLQKLRLIYPQEPRVQVARRTVTALQHLKLLKVLVFENAKFSESVVFDVGGPIKQMRVLLFVDCELDRQRLRGFRATFPNLEELQFPSRLLPFHFSDHIK